MHTQAALFTPCRHHQRRLCSQSTRWCVAHSTQLGLEQLQEAREVGEGSRRRSTAFRLVATASPWCGQGANVFTGSWAPNGYKAVGKRKRVCACLSEGNLGGSVQAHTVRTLGRRSRRQPVRAGGMRARRSLRSQWRHGRPVDRCGFEQGR